MSRHVTIMTLAAFTLAAAACGGEDAAENLIENAIERESGEDINLDFDDDGSFSIETEEGSMTMDEDGNFVITDESGEVITGDVDTEGGGIDIESDDGSFSMESDDDGSMTFETDEGSMTIEAGTEIPDEWPGDVPRPEGLDVDSASTATIDGTVQLSVVGMTGDGEQWAESYGAALENAGFSESMSFTSSDSIQTSYQRDTETVSVIGTANSGEPWDVIVSYMDMPG